MSDEDLGFKHNHPGDDRAQRLHNDTPSGIDFGDQGLTDEMWDQLSQLRFVEQRVLSALAVGLGWRTDFSKGIHLTAPDGTKLNLPIQSNLNAKMFRSRVNSIVRHRGAAKPGRLMTVVEAIIAHPKVKLDPDRVAVLREAVAHAPAQKVQVEVVPEVASGKPVSGHRKLRIIREEPWSAIRNAKGETYPSDAVMERHWSNGTVDFRCRWEEDLSDRSKGCDWTNESPRSVASHNANHKAGMGQQPQPEVDGIDPEHVSNPRKLTRIRRLASEIDGALTAALAAGIVADPQWLAQWIIDHRIEALPSASEEEPEVLSEDQILDKIAALVDRGRGKILREQVDTLQGQVETFMAQVAAAEAKAKAAEDRASWADGNLQALSELLDDLRRRKQEEGS